MYAICIQRTRTVNSTMYINSIFANISYQKIKQMNSNTPMYEPIDFATTIKKLEVVSFMYGMFRRAFFHFSSFCFLFNTFSLFNARSNYHFESNDKSNKKQSKKKKKRWAFEPPNTNQQETVLRFDLLNITHKPVLGCVYCNTTRLVMCAHYLN